MIHLNTLASVELEASLSKRKGIQNLEKSTVAYKHWRSAATSASFDIASGSSARGVKVIGK